MIHLGFFDRAGPFTIDVIAQAIGATLSEDADRHREIEDIRPLHSAGPQHLSFFDNAKYASALGVTHAGACIIGSGFANRAPPSTIIMTASVPYSSFARAMTLFYADALHTKAANVPAELSTPFVHETAKVSESCIIEPGAVVWARGRHR